MLSAELNPSSLSTGGRTVCGIDGVYFRFDELRHKAEGFCNHTARLGEDVGLYYAFMWEVGKSKPIGARPWLARGRRTNGSSLSLRLPFELFGYAFLEHKTWRTSFLCNQSGGHSGSATPYGRATDHFSSARSVPPRKDGALLST